MRYLIDNNVFLFLDNDYEILDKEVCQIVEDYHNILFISTESVKELILFYRKQKNKTKFWKNETEMVLSIESEYGMKILPVKKEHLLTYANLSTNEAEEMFTIS